MFLFVLGAAGLLAGLLDIGGPMTPATRWLLIAGGIVFCLLSAVTGDSQAELRRGRDPRDK